MGLFGKLKEGLSKTRNNIVSGIDSVFGGFTSIDDDFYDELEEILIMGDIGVKSSGEIMERLKTQVKENHVKEPGQCRELLIQSIKVIGLNGAGKTTSVGKLASLLKQQGKKVLIAAADTYRAAACEQLCEWAARAGVDIITGSQGADPSSVIFDAVNAAKARNVDVLICDTAGRLHNKRNLMEELKKMNRVIDREYSYSYRENLIVLDGTTGQNALNQAREFGETTAITGIVLTKMDGTSKGGIAVAIQSELGIPVKYIGVGEKVEDLQRFDPDQFVNALFDVEAED